jgi:hypothetical protein
MLIFRADKTQPNRKVYTRGIEKFIYVYLPNYFPAHFAAILILLAMVEQDST